MLSKAEELRHIAEGALEHERANGVGTVDVVGVTDADPAAVLARCREVALAVLEPVGEEAPELEAWCAVVPRWFRDACSPEMTRQEPRRWLAHWRGLDHEAKLRAEWEKGYDLPGWLYWLEPAQREWRWWDAAARPGEAAITVEIPGWLLAEEPVG